MLSGFDTEMPIEALGMRRWLSTIVSSATASETRCATRSMCLGCNISVTTTTNSSPPNRLA